MNVLKKRVATAVLAMIFLLSCTVFVFADTAVVTTSDGGSVNMRAEASTDSDVVNFLDDGTEVEVLGTSGDWTQVSYDGYTGYVMSSYLTSSDSSEDTQADDTSEDTTTEDTAADDTAADDTAAEDTASEEAASDTVSEDTDTAAAAEAETADAGEDETDDSTSEQLAKYKKLVMILGLVCLILVIIIINLLLFYRRGYYDDDDECDDEDDDYDDEEDDDDRHVTAEPEYEPIRVPQETREIEVPDISSLVEESTAEAFKETETPKDAAETTDSDDLELEFFDLDDL